MEGIEWHKKPKLKDPCLIVAWPGMGEVAIKAATYLVDKLKAEPFAQINPQDFFYLTGSMVQEGILSLPELPYSKFYYWKNPVAKQGLPTRIIEGVGEFADLIIFCSDAQPDLERLMITASGFCRWPRPVRSR
jgi:proteasome assembly chaperone (PAC2) family protein